MNPLRADAEFFEKSVRPLLVEKCWPCHGDAGRPKGGLRLTSRPSLLKGGDSGAAAVAGDPAASLLIQAIRYEHEPKMPPKGKLTDREIEVLTRWVAHGASVARDQRRRPRRAAETPRRPPYRRATAVLGVPAGQGRGRAGGPRHVVGPVRHRPLPAGGPREARAGTRRAGRPAHPAQTGHLRPDRPAADARRRSTPSSPIDRPQAFARVVDRLLASPRYGERWGRHWLDVVRYADARDLIQLPAESDFREAWRYRDWVVEAFNRDLPYPEFVRHQVAGDLLPPPRPGGINKDGLVATGLLAIADFVPGDVDKDQMIADYVNDQIDVVSRAFLGLSVACARCHDHKFDPISTEDYYALAGIFFSTRLIPGPVPGNTPLGARAPAVRRTSSTRFKARDAADKRRRAELEQQLPDAADRAYVALLRQLVADKTASYLVAASEYRQRMPGQASRPLAELARRSGLDEDLLAGFVAYLDRVAAQPSIDRHPTVRDAAAGTLAGSRLEKAAAELQHELAALAARQEKESARSPSERRPGARLTDPPAGR